MTVVAVKLILKMDEIKKGSTTRDSRLSDPLLTSAKFNRGKSKSHSVIKVLKGRTCHMVFVRKTSVSGKR